MHTTVAALMRTLRGGASGAPRLTWYGTAGERVELSGRVLDNWVAKTANLLTEELDVEPGDIVEIDLPPQWKGAVIALAAWQAGAVVSFVGRSEEGSDTDSEGVSSSPGAKVLFTDAPETHLSAAGFPRDRNVVAVSLGALALSWPGTLPSGVLDYSAMVRQFADSYEPLDPPAPEDPALLGVPGAEIPEADQAGLFASYAVQRAPGARVLVRGGGRLSAVIAALLGAWSADGSAVLLHAEAEDSPHLRETERITEA